MVSLKDLSINNNSFHILSFVLIVVIYFSAFKGGKPTCDRYLLNSFLYLLIISSLYFSSLKIQNDYNIKMDKKMSHILLSIVVSIVLLIIMYMVKNPIIKHLVLVAIIFILALSGKNFYEKYDKEYIDEILKKSIVIVMICGLVGVLFGKYLSPKVEMILMYTFIITFLYYIIDSFFLKSKNRDIVNYLFVIIFSGFIMFDTNRIISDSKSCVEGNADYIGNMFDMYLNIINIVSSLAELGE
jgi:FtsH-binding integral membrane protein